MFLSFCMLIHIVGLLFILNPNDTCVSHSRVYLDNGRLPIVVDIDGKCVAFPRMLKTKGQIALQVQFQIFNDMHRFVSIVCNKLESSTPLVNSIAECLTRAVKSRLWCCLYRAKLCSFMLTDPSFNIHNFLESHRIKANAKVDT